MAYFLLFNALVVDCRMEICICSGHHHIKSYRNDMILNPCADSAVDIAIAEAPQQLGLKFLTKLQPLTMW